MSVYLVTWDLNKEKSNYAAARNVFLTTLNDFDNIRDPALDSVRFISTPWSADQVSNHLRTGLDNNDRIVVTKMVSGEHQGWLHQDVWTWIDARL